MSRIKLPLLLSVYLAFAAISVVPQEVPSARALTVVIIRKHLKPHKRRHKHVAHTIKTVVLKPTVKPILIKPVAVHKLDIPVIKKK